MTFFRQLTSLTMTGIRGIPQRLGASLVTVIGIATVVAVLLSLLSMGEGLKYLSSAGSRDDRVIVTSAGAPFVFQSVIPRDTAARVAAAPGVRKSADGTPLATASMMTSVDLIRKDGARGSIVLLGMQQTARDVFPELKIVEGRFYRSGLREVIVSRSGQTLYRGLAVGDRLSIRGGEWTVVGAFEDTGSVFDMTLLGDGDTVLSAFGQGAWQSVTVMLESSRNFGVFKDALTSDVSLKVDVKTELEGRAEGLRGMRGLLDFVSYFIGSVMASGAIFGALNSLYASVESRRREIATLRAIGFGGGAVVISVLLEALVLALPAALIGTAIAWLLFNGDSVSTQGITFKLAVTPHLVGVSIAWALAIAFIGGSLPALRAARAPVATAIRAS
jgi:putative ABC transport system permease protein